MERYLEISEEYNNYQDRILSGLAKLTKKYDQNNPLLWQVQLTTLKYGGQ